MNVQKHAKFLTIISVISIVTVAGIITIARNIALGVAIGLLSDAVQIVTYALWLLQKEVDLSKVPLQVTEIHEIITREKQESKAAEEIITRLIREGVVKEEELLSMIRSKEIMLAFPYAEGLKGKILQISKGQPLAKLLGQIGFVRVALFQNLMAAFVEYLPKQLRDIDALNSFIKQQLPREWNRISDEVSRSYPPEKYKILEKWRSKTGFRVSYILSKSNAQDFLIDYLNRNSFTTDFQKHIIGRIDRKELKRMLKIKKHQVREVMSKVSMEFLMGDVPKSVRESIVKNEAEVKKSLKVKTINDVRLVQPEELAKVFKNFQPGIEPSLAAEFSIRIIGESQKCYDCLNNLGISLE